MKKILVISPVPSHPYNAGNRARVYSILESFKQMGHEVYFMHVQQEEGDNQAMRFYWGDRFYSISYTKPSTAVKNFTRIDAKIIRRIKALFTSDPLYTYAIDDWYDDSINEKITSVAKNISPDMVLVVYAFFSKALELFDQNVVKMIDSQDRFTNRYKLYQKKGMMPRWFSTTKTEELKGLSRADVIIAIQQQEADWIAKRLAHRQTVTVGHLVSLHRHHFERFRYTILFVASKNPINVNGIDYFIKQVFPRLKAKLNRPIELILAGDICEKVEFEDCLKLGRVENIKDAYDRADIVISPILLGTGLKIKNIEALGYSKPLVTTSVGAEGLEKGANEAFLIADSPSEFAAAIANIFSNVELYQKLSHNAYNFAQEWNKSCLKVLTDILNLK